MTEKYLSRGKIINVKKGKIIFLQGKNLFKIFSPVKFSWSGRKHWRFTLLKGKVFLKIINPVSLNIENSHFKFFSGLYKIENYAGRIIRVHNLFGQVNFTNSIVLTNDKKLEIRRNKKSRIRNLTLAESREIARYFSFTSGFSQNPYIEKSRYIKYLRKIAADGKKPEFILTSPWPLIYKPFFKLNGWIIEEHLDRATFKLNNHPEKIIPLIGNSFDYPLKITYPGQHRIILRAWDKNQNETVKVIFFEYLKF
ncbi:hypothetical protein ACFL35_20300 [Candidatus Riflebacteria bacterium]